MKRVLAVLFAVLLLCMACTGCESEEEKARRKIAEATAAYEESKARVDSLQAQLDAVNAAISAIENG